ncbi:MAG: Hsp20/alpha crystallin family protein [Planctomycetaceae bacterium]|nr:Hsp20/alpha crystallin family protein [Planctomycetaceae bacterium]
MNANTCCSPQSESCTTEATPRSATRTYRPAVDIYDAPDAVHLVADLPGVSENDVDISMDKNVLTIAGKVEPARFEGTVPFTTEYGVGNWERSFAISSEIDRSGIDATVKDGVLRVRLPKSTEAASRKIRVTAG